MGSARGVSAQLGQHIRRDDLPDFGVDTSQIYWNHARDAPHGTLPSRSRFLRRTGRPMRSLSVEFDRKLDSLFERYTHRVRRQATGRPIGRAPSLRKAKLRKAIDELVAIARRVQLRTVGVPEFDALVEAKHQWHAKRGKGRGPEAKRVSFSRWWDRRVTRRTCIYVFWQGRLCAYVGRTGRGGGRPQRHFDRHWFQSVTRIDVYEIPGKRSLAKAECLAIDRFQPRRNRMKSARQWGKSKCPVCTHESKVRADLEWLFQPVRS